MNDIVIVGAGKTGRGFLGRLCAEAGVHVTYVDKNAELAAAHETINRLQTAATKKPTPTQAALETAVLRAERDIYKSVADRLLDK